MSISSTPVQQATGLLSTGSLTGTITLGAAPTSGDLLVFTARAATNANSITSISQTNVTWTQVVVETASGQYADIWQGVVSGAGGTTITATANNTTAGFRLEASEWSGIVTTTADVSGTNTGTGTNTATGTITPTSGFNELIIALGGISGPLVSGPTNSFTALTTGNVNGQIAYLVVASTTGTYSTDWTGTGSITWDCVFATWKGPAAGDTLFGSQSMLMM